MRRWIVRGRVAALALLASPCFAAAAPQQRPQPPAATSPAQPAIAPQPPAPPGSTTEDLGILRPDRPALVREGSYLVDQQGTMRRDERSGAWMFRFQIDGAARPIDLFIMPSTLLGQMEQMMDAGAAAPLLFEMTGEVFVYRGHNYLLPTHAPRLLGQESAAETTATTEPESEPAARTEIDTAAGAGAAEPADQEPRPGDAARRIMRNLERATGPLAQNPGASSRFAPPEPPPAATGEPVREGAILVDRRGQLRRDAGGGWYVIFDADAAGLADPPMRLMPCLLLEQIDRYAQTAGRHAPILISGNVYLYRGRNHLLPTVFRIPRERTGLQP